MGLLRLYITLIIVIGHLHTWYGFSFPWLSMVWSGGLMGIARVHVYFLQSGFLTQMQFASPAKKPDTVLHYYHKRLLRIYPQYLLFLALTVLACSIFQDTAYLRQMEQKGIGTMQMVVFNLLALNVPTLKVWDMNPHVASGYLLLPQAWTLTIQFVFILLAPFVLCSGRRLSAMALLCGGLMLYYYMRTMLVRNFLVTELAYFWFGALIARLTLRLEGRLTHRGVLLLAAVFIVPAIVIALWYARLQTMAGAWPAFAIFNMLLAASMIPAYVLSRGSAVDRFFSKMTYSLYLCHMLVAMFVQRLVLTPHFSGVITVLLALTIAVAINLPVVTGIRQRFLTLAFRKS